MKECLAIVNAVHQNVRKVIQGKDEQIRQVICCWLAGGHILIEDFPGTGKTMLARAIAKSARVEFKRVQFTPDLLPSDITGASVYSQKKSAFEFMKGPLFTTLLLGDEINRATPRTQSALLEGMAEGQVSAEGVTWPLHPLFFVMATQNPVEQHGTFPLPEAQLDRFMMKISMGYPKLEEEIDLIRRQNESHPIQTIVEVVTEEHIRFVRDTVRTIKISDAVLKYIATLVQATRTHADIRLGASPRASIALVRTSQTAALMEGLTYVSPTHAFNLARSVIAHRLTLTAEARLAGKTALGVLDEVIRSIAVPVNPA